MAKALGRKTVTFRIIPINEARFGSLKGIEEDLRKALEKEAFWHRKMLRATVGTWTGTKPQFRSIIRISPKALSITTGPHGNGPGAQKWRWLEHGTKIRWAVMSRGWTSKTRRGFLGSGPGFGRVVIAGKRAMMARNIRPRPGIKARNWLAEVHKIRSRAFLRDLRKTFAIIARDTISTKGLRK